MRSSGSSPNRSVRWWSTGPAASTSTASCCESRSRPKSHRSSTIRWASRIRSTRCRARARPTGRNYSEFTETPVYSFEMLQPGNVVQGPAVIDAELTTVVIPPGQRFSVDQHGLGILEN